MTRGRLTYWRPPYKNCLQATLVTVWSLLTGTGVINATLSIDWQSRLQLFAFCLPHAFCIAAACAQTDFKGRSQDSKVAGFSFLYFQFYCCYFKYSWLIPTNRDETTWLASRFPYPAPISEISMGSVKLWFALSDDDCFCALWTETLLQSFDVFDAHESDNFINLLLCKCTQWIARDIEPHEYATVSNKTV
jgi:hypothetical protein